MSTRETAPLDAFVAQLPKVELHVHLLGSAPVETVLQLARRHPSAGIPVSAEALRAYYSFRDFPHFIEIYTAVTRLLTGPEDIADLIRGVARVLAGQRCGSRWRPRRRARSASGSAGSRPAGRPTAT